MPRRRQVRGRRGQALAAPATTHQPAPHERATMPGTSTIPAITNPEMEDTHYGIPTTCIGEDGDMLALGHHAPRRALAAFNRHARVFLGLANLVDDRGAHAVDYLDGIHQEWAVFRQPNPDDQWEGPDWTWVADWSDPHHPDARPVTVFTT
jgi:hypothetical protein